MNRPEPVLLRAPAGGTLEAVEAVAWENRPVALHPDLLTGIDRAREAMLAALDGRRVYGVNTGMGYLAGITLSAEEQRAHQWNLLLGRAVGGPPYLPAAEVRALLFTRLAGFLSGHAGVSTALCSFLVDRLNDGFLPCVPRTGIGTAGEIIPLAHAFQTFLGVGRVLTPEGGGEDAAAALSRRNVAPYTPGVKEGIALLAGAPLAVALAVARRRDAVTLQRQLEIIWAAAVDALGAPHAPYDPAVAELAADPLMAGVLERFNRLLSGGDQAGLVLQAPVSLRVIPQVLTHLVRTVARAEEDIRRVLSATPDSPAFTGGRFVGTGEFHALGLAAALDALTLAHLHAAELAAQHVHRLLDRRFTGLPDQLAPHPGPQAGLVVVQKRVAGVLHHLRRLAIPSSLGSIDTSLGQEDVQTFAPEAAENLRTVQSGLREILAAELLLCRQAWHLRGGSAPGLQRYAAVAAELVDPVEQDRPLGADIGTLVSALEDGRI